MCHQLLLFRVSLRGQLIKMHELVHKFRITVGLSPSAIPSLLSDSRYWPYSQAYTDTLFVTLRIRLYGEQVTQLFFSVCFQYQLLQPSHSQDKAANFLWKMASPLKVRPPPGQQSANDYLLVFTCTGDISGQQLHVSSMITTMNRLHIFLSYSFAVRVWAPVLKVWSFMCGPPPYCKCLRYIFRQL